MDRSRPICHRTVPLQKIRVPLLEGVIEELVNHFRVALGGRSGGSSSLGKFWYQLRMEGLRQRLRAGRALVSYVVSNFF